MNKAFLMAAGSQNLFPGLLAQGGVIDETDRDRIHAWLLANRKNLPGRSIISLSGLLVLAAEPETSAAAIRLSEKGLLENVIEDWLTLNGFKIGERVADAISRPGQGKSSASAQGGPKLGRSIKAYIKDDSLFTESETTIDNTLFKTSLSAPFYSEGGSDTKATTFDLKHKYTFGNAWDDKKEPYNKFKTGLSGTLVIADFTTEVFLGFSADDKDTFALLDPELKAVGKYKYGQLTGSLEYDLNSRFATGMIYATRSGIHSVGLKVGYNDQTKTASYTGSYGLDLSGGRKVWTLGVDVNPSSVPLPEMFTFKIKYVPK